MIRHLPSVLIAALLAVSCVPAAARTETPKRLAGLDNPEHIRCAREASRAFAVPFAAVLILLDVERGWSGAEQPNRDDDGNIISHDLGPMQINDRAWLSTFETAGITRDQLKNDACVNIHAGAWILGKHLQAIRAERATMPPEEAQLRDPIEVEAVLRYHSRTPKFQERYLQHVLKAVERGLRAVAQQ